MKTDNGKVKIKAYVVVSLMILLAVSVLAGTVYAVTLDITDAQPVAAGIGSGSVGDGEARPFNWTLDTSQDSNFKPVTNISGKLDGADNSTQNVTTTGYSGNLYDNAVTVTLGGDTPGSSAFYNTNLVYTLKNPGDETEYAKFRIFQDSIIPVGSTTQETLEHYVSAPTVSDVADTYGVCETLTFTLSVPENGMSVTSMPMYTYIPIEIRHRVVDENGNYLRDADSSLTTTVERYQYNSTNATDYTNNKYFYVSSNTDYYDNLTSASPTYTPASFNASGASTKAWMAKGYYFHGFYLSPQTAEGYNFKDITYAVSSRTGEIVSDTNDASNDRRQKVSGFAADGNKFRLEYGDSSGWDSDYIAADKIVVYVNYTQDSSYVPVVTPGSTYSITVNSHFEDAVNDDEHSQYIEIYNDTTQNPIARTKNHVAAAMPADNTTPTLNLKSNAKVSVKSVVVKDENGNNITSQAFGYDQYYTDFIESCKTSLFGFVELQNITGNITVDVTYGEPVADKTMGYSSSYPYYSVTVVTKGDVGPYNKSYRDDYQYQDLDFGWYSTFDTETNTMDETRSANPIFNNSGHYPMRDGGQITRYDYSNNYAYLDYSVYSYISDVKMYYNDTGEEVKDLSSMAGRKIACYNSDTYNHYYGGDTGRSVTYVVTYKKFDSTTVYAKIDSIQGGRHESRMAIAEGDTNAYFADSYTYGYASNIYSNGIDENENPLTHTTSTSGYWGKLTVLDSDSIKFRVRDEGSNSVKFSNVKVYALDVNTDTAGELIAGEGCSDPQVTIEYSPNRPDYQTEGWVKISGLKAYGGNIYVIADEYRYNTKVNLQSGDEHTAGFTITADDAMGAISGAGQSGADSNMLSTYTKPATEGKTVHWMYSGAGYTVSSSGEQALQKVTVAYSQIPNGTSRTLTFDQKNQDGSITVSYPEDNQNYYSANTTVTVYFEPITTYEAQVYITASTVPVLNEYWLKSNSTEMAEISTYDGDTPSVKIFNTVAGAVTAYQAKGIGCVTSAGNADRIYKIAPGATVKVRNIFVEEGRDVSSSLPQSLKDFVNRRFTFNGVKVYKASSFSHNSDGYAVLGDEIQVAKEGDYYVFTMPESGVRIVPEYDQHVRTLNVLSNQRDDNGRTYSIISSTIGSATLTGDDDSWFITPSWYDCDDRYDNTGNASHQWGPERVLTLDGSRYTLTATPADSDGYVAKSVKAYKYPYTYTAQNNNIWQSTLYDATYNWLTYDDEGNITNEEIPNVAGEFGDPDENGARSCTITLPDNLDVGVVVLVVEFAPKDTTTFAHFKYEPDAASAKPFNPIVNFSGIFSGAHADYTSVTATEGADVETAVYDAQNAEYLNFEIGGNNKFGSAFYQYNLTYTIKDYTDDTVLAKFRVYRDQIYPIDCTEAQLNEYLAVSACTFEEVSGTSGVCEKATLRFKVPEEGITVSYQSERLYIPVTVKQYVKNAADEYVPANSDLTATLTKYFESSTDISDFARNKFFAADSTLTSSTGLNAAGNSAFADTVTVTGAEKTYYMLIENASDWQGFYVQPSTARGYAVSSDGLSQISYNRLGDANNWDGDMTDDTKTYVEGSGYRVRYRAEYNYSMSYNSSDISSHMGGQRVEVSLYYEQTDDYYSSFSYNLSSSSAFTPKTLFKGTIQYDVDGVVNGTDGNINLSVPAYDSTSAESKFLTMEVGGDSCNNSVFHEANLVYTLTDKTTRAEVLKFRIYRGQIEPVGVYSQTAFNNYINSASVETYSRSQYDGLMEKASVQFKIPETGLSVIFKCEPIYLPVTVKQYVLDSNGSASAAGNTFTSDITKAPSGEDDFTRVKYFAADNTLTDSYGLGSADQSEFVNNYTAAGASDTHFMYYRNYNDGLYIKPAPAEGYALATVQAKAFNKKGDVISYNQSLTGIPTYKHAEKGYSISYRGYYNRYLQGAAIEVDVYYQPSTTLTVNQTIDGIISPTGLLASVTVTNANPSAPVSPYKAYVNPINNDLPADSFVIEDSASNMTAGENGGNVRSDAFTVNKGTKPQLAIKPEGSRTIASVTIYKKIGGEYQEVSADSYTFAESNGTQTYTFKNEYAIGDDYKVDIVFGVEKTLTVKAVMLNDNNSTNIVDTDAEFALTKATINVTGQRYDVNGNNTEDKAFIKESQEINSFSVTNAPVSVTAYTNTNVTVQTNIEQSSKYVIANVVALKENTNVDLHLVVPQSRKIDGKDVVTYETCTLPSLTSGDSNIEVLVYLAKVADVKVSVYNVLSDGTIVDGVPQKDGSADGYVNVNVASNGINQKAIITADDEGGYYTGDFDITFAPNERTVKVIQGSNLNIFAQLPGNGQYVIRKVVCDGTGYQNIKVKDVSFSSGNLRETLDTNSTSVAAGGNYEIKIYIAEAKSIFTRVTNDNSGTGTYTSGSVTVRGNHSEDGVIPFTKISPVSSDAQRVNYYDAVTTSSSLDYTTEAKCIRDTALSFDVTPQTNYQIKSVSVKRGMTKETAADIEYSAGSANSSGTITYTIADPMPFANGNIYIDVEFTLAQTGNVRIDFQYTDDFVNYYNVFDTDESKRLAYMNVSSYLPSVSQHKVEDIQTNEQFDNKCYNVGTNVGYEFKVLAGNRFSVSTTAYKDGLWYIVPKGEGYAYDTDTGDILEYFTATGASASMSRYINAGQNITFRFRLVPMSTIGGIEVDNNCYNYTPDGVRKDDSGSTRVNAHFTNGESYNPKIQNSLYVFPSCSWTDSFSHGYNGYIVGGSVIDSVQIDYNTVVKPGKIKSVTVYELNKGIISDFSYDNSYAEIQPHLHESATDGYTRKWVLTSNGESDPYTFTCKDETIQTLGNKTYRVVYDYDRITVESIMSGNGTGYLSTYLYFTNDPDEIFISESPSDKWVSITRRFDESITQKTSAYFVLVSDLSPYDLPIGSAKFYDYKDQREVDILNALVKTTRSVSGVTKYYYYWKITPDDPTHPIDNSMRFSVYANLRSEYVPEVHEENPDCNITVEQWNRDTYDGNYVAATNQSVSFSVPLGDVLKNAETGIASNPLTVTAPMGYLYSHKGTTLTITPNPADGYNVERIEIVDGYTGYYTVEDGGSVEKSLRYSNVTVRVYYSRPLLRISSTNEGNQGKAIVDVVNNTAGTTENVLSQNTFTNGIFVTKNDNAQVIIKPLTYTDEGTDYYYTVDSIRIGDAFNNTLTAYTAAAGDKANDDYTITKNADGSEYILTLNSVTRDKYIFIQLVGKEKIYSSNLQINQKIKLPGSSEYVDCYEGLFGSVTVSGSLQDVDTPLSFYGNDVSTYTFNDTATVEGTARYNTLISLSATPPTEDYCIKEISVNMNGESIDVTENNGVYTLNAPAPDSGSTVITVKYALAVTPYTFVYKYQGRSGGNDGSYIGDNGGSDEKTYTVNADLYPADLTKDGKPTAKAISDRAPAVDDLYKDCKWVIDDKVEYNTDSNTVTVTASQPAKTYNVEFFFTTGKDEADKVLSGIKLNSLATDNEGKFIQAPAKSGESEFGYWSVLENGKEIAKCYSRSFNLRVTGNYKVIAMYEERAAVLSISDPRYTRQQYDLNGSKVDKLQVDFLLAYMESNGLLLNSELAAENGYKSGIVVEYFDDCVIHKDDITGGTLTEEDKASVTLPGVNEESVKTFIDSDSNSSANGEQHLLKYIVQNNKYNNKNRVDRVINFNNSEGARHMVFRAYYYVSHVVDGETVTELTAPVTFYLYDIGNSDSAAEEG